MLRPFYQNQLTACFKGFHYKKHVAACRGDTPMLVYCAAHFVPDLAILQLTCLPKLNQVP